MSFLFALLLAPTPYTPEIEAIMRHRDEKRRLEAMARVTQANEEKSLASVIPPAIAERLSSCLTAADIKPEGGVSDAEAWAKEGGGAYAAHCRGYALVKAERYTEATMAYEAGASASGVEPEMRARLFSQAGNVALLNGDIPRANVAFDLALERPLPATLATGEIHLDRARARVAAEELKGARNDLDKALQMAPMDPLGWLLSATLARRVEDLALARAHIEQAAKLARNDANIAIEQGVIYALSADRDPAARAAFQRAEEIAGKDSELGKRAQAYLAQLPAEAKAPAKR